MFEPESSAVIWGMTDVEHVLEVTYLWQTAQHVSTEMLLHME